MTATLSEDLAHAAGLDPDRERLVLVLALAVVVAVALKVVGALLIAAMLIIPAAAARGLARTPETMAETAEPLCVAVGLGEDACDLRDGVAEQAGEGAGAGKAAARHLGVHQPEWHPGARGFSDHHRPDLDFEDEDRLGTRCAEEAPPGCRSLDRKVAGDEAALLDLGSEGRLGGSATRGGEVRGHDALAPVEERADEGNGGPHLAEADGVDDNGALKGRPEAVAFIEVQAVGGVAPGAAEEVSAGERHAEQPHKAVEGQRDAVAERHVVCSGVHSVASVGAGAVCPRTPEDTWGRKKADRIMRAGP
jgi:hypothetical protein